MKRILLIFFLFPFSFSLLKAQIPRPEHPKPQFERAEWKNLNGQWDLTFDFGDSGRERDFYRELSHYDKKITVPFPPESKLSGVNHKDFMASIWYHRLVDIPSDWEGKRIFLHFGAVDYKATLWVNGKEVDKHYGGSTSFSFEITDQLNSGKNDIFLQAEDDIRSGVQPAGKQSERYYKRGAKYSRVTGIWQTVWLEARPQSFVQRVEVVPDVDNSRFVLTPEFSNFRNGQLFKAILLDKEGREVATGTTSTNGGTVTLDVENPKLWSPEHPYLYNLKYKLLEDGNVLDNIDSYAGLRKIHVSDNKIYLNNEPIFLRFVLDQGFYPNGIWTAPTDAALKKDILLAKDVGFNGARLHQKVFEERFHYWADKLGYLTMAEFSDWGIKRTYTNPEGWANLTREWREALKRDINHPSIIIWTPMNEIYAARQNYEAYRRAGKEMYRLTRDLDPTRPVNTASGFLHIETDIWTVHDYTQDPHNFAKLFQNIRSGGKDEVFMVGDWYGEVDEYDVEYEGQPYVVDEYGGTYWLPSYVDQEPRGSRKGNWGYGKSADEVANLIADLSKALLKNSDIAGFTYTQLTDINQEVNGIYTFERDLKFDKETLRKAFGGPAAIEQE